MVLKKYDKQLALSFSMMLCMLVQCVLVLQVEHVRIVPYVIAVFLAATILTSIKAFDAKRAQTRQVSDSNAKKFMLLALVLLALELVLIGMIYLKYQIPGLTSTAIFFMRAVCVISAVAGMFAALKSKTSTAQWIGVYSVCMCTLLVCNLAFSVLMSMSL